MALPAARHQEISSNKFYPPQVGADITLFRTSLVMELLGESACNRKAIVIEAQAGQGKSTLALQFLQHFNLRFSWYQIGSEDSDPALLLSTLLENLKQKLPGFTSPSLSRIMHQEEIDSLDIIHCANILLSDLDRHLADDFWIVFDDLHLGEQASLFNSLLSHIIDTSPPHIHFILISRKPLLLGAKTLRYGANIITLVNHNLSFSLKEVEELFANILARPISRLDAERIRKQTSGWIMGILLAAHAAAHQNSATFSAKIGTRMPADLSAEQIVQYFRDEILTHVPRKLHYPLMLLSLLDTVPVDLAATITGKDDIAAILTDLMLDNFFIYPLDEEQMVFRFHHLFQEFLQEKAKNELKKKEIHNVFRTAATYYLDRKSIVQALLYYRKEDNYPVMEDILRREGLNLMAKNRTVTLLTLLRTIPEKDLLNYPWLTFFTAIVHSDSTPTKAFPLLESARCHFINCGDETGEILALVHLIFFHFVVSGLYNTGAKLLARTEELFLSNQNDLPLQARVLIARNLGAGYAFFLFSLKKARKYAQLARDLAHRQDIHNGIAASRFVCGYIETLSDNRRKCLQEIELSAPLLRDPLVGISNKLTLSVLQLNTLSKDGDLVNFNHQHNLLRAYIDSLLVEQTLAAPFGYVWGSIGLIQEGKIDQAEHCLQRGMKASTTARTPHMLSQFYQWLSYIQAVKGHRTAAKQSADEAITLRKDAGGPFYITLSAIICGAAFTRIGDSTRAEKFLSRGIKNAQQLPSAYLLTTAHWQRAWLYRQTGRRKAMLRDLRAGLELMEKHNFTTFWSWEPVFIQELLGEAVRNEIHSQFADLLARRRLGVFYTNDGTSLPLLKISVLGTFSIKVADRVVLGIEDMTPAQRNLMALLLAEKNQQTGQEKIQLALWPDSPPQKTRAKLDTLITRLRKVLDKALPCPASHYLKMSKSILILDNCRIDAVEFSSLAGEGLHQLAAENFWQAGNAFYRALQLWGTASSPRGDLFLGETAAYYDHLLDLLAKIGHKYGVILAETDCTEEAIETVLKVLRICPMEDRLITLLYTLYLRSVDMLKAKALLQQYRQTMRDQGYTQDEIDEVLFRVATSTAV